MHHIVNHWSGGDGQFIYDIYSGVAALLVGIGLNGLLFHGLRSRKCHTAWCPFPGRHDYEMDGATYRLCARHHPAARKIRRCHILAHHAAKKLD